MEYKEYLAVLLVLGILSIEPAAAVEIGSFNQVNSPYMLNLGDKNQKIIDENIINNQGNNFELHGLKSNKLAINCKNTSKLTLNNLKKHKYHKQLQSSLTTIYNKNKQKLYNSPHKTSINPVKSAEISLNISIDDKNIKGNVTNLNTDGINETALNQTGENKIDFNQTVEIENNTNGTALNSTTDENKTALNHTGNGTIVNENNISGTSLNTDKNGTVSNQNDNPTKVHVLNTIENAGYAFAAIAGCFAVGAAVAPEGVCKTVCVVGAIACGVIAVACFVTYIFVDWFW